MSESESLEKIHATGDVFDDVLEDVEDRFFDECDSYKDALGIATKENCGDEFKRPGLNFFSILGISGGSILSISVVGGIIGTIVGVIYVSSSSDFQDDGSGVATFFAFLIVLLFLGGGALVGAILGAIVGIVISLRSIPNKTKEITLG